MTDPIAALRTYLLADPTVQSLSGGRVFNELLPATEAKLMPRPAVVIQSYGGTGYATMSVNNRDYHLRCYGVAAADARQLTEAVTAVLRGLNRLTVGTTLLHSALLQTGPFYGRDPDTYWYFYYSTWSVQTDYREVN